MTPQIIVASHRKEDHEFAQAVALKIGFLCTRAYSDEEIRKALTQNQKSILFHEIDSVDESLKNPISFRLTAPSLTKLLAPRYVFGISACSVFEISKQIRISAIGHFIRRQYDDFGVHWTARVCKALYHPEQLSIENLKDEGREIQKITLKGSTEKRVALEAFRRLMTKNNIQFRAIEVVLGALDELIMNAVYDAPRDMRGRYYQREAPRSTEFELKEKEHVTVSITLGEKFITIAVTDQFGSFEPDRALNTILKNHSETEYIANQKTQSAGLGIHGIAAKGVSLLITSQSNLQTEASISFPYFQSLKEARNSFRSFSLLKA